jgi:signal transduction histidine kinase
LGLSIVKKIMEAHSGSIAVEDDPGRGARFIMRFRLAVAHMPRSPG